MTGPREHFIKANSLRFRALTWGDHGEAVLFLHGLGGIAEVWGPAVQALPASRRYIAIDQRGHGQSSAPATGYSAHHMLKDLQLVLQELGEVVHLVGHSMGARIALLAAARMPRMLRTATVVDIGPDASKSNIEATVRGVASRPERFASQEEALAFAFRTRAPSPEDVHIFLARLKAGQDGSFTWRSPRAALNETVTRQRSRSYWREWRNIAMPALFIHGGASNEVSTAIADRMRTENPAIAFERFEGIGHNIPLIAPQQLAESLERFWTTSAKSAT